MKAKPLIQYLVIFIFVVVMAFYVFSPEKNDPVSLDTRQCRNAEEIVRVVELHKSILGYYPFSLADLLVFQNGVLEKKLYKFSGDKYYLNNYGYLPAYDGYRVTFLGPESGKTYSIKNKAGLESACSKDKLGSL